MAKLSKKGEKNELIALQNYLDDTWEFRYNEIANIIEWRKRSSNSSFSKLHEKDLWKDIQRNHSKTAMEYLLNTVGGTDTSKPYNPIKDWLENLPSFTLDDPIRNLCEYIILDDESDKDRLVSNFKKWFVGSVKTLYESRYAHKHAIIFCGPSGIGKTPFFNAILPEELAESYLKDSPVFEPKDKDSKISLTRFLILLFDEIDCFFKSETNRRNYKLFMSKVHVNERLPYDKSETPRPRICSFLGTCNEAQFLNDPTGTQRFNVFTLSHFLNKKHGVDEGIEKFQRDHIWQCWKWAYNAYLDGFDPEFSKEEDVINEERNEIYKYNSPEYEIVIKFLEHGDKNDFFVEFMTPTEICSYLNSKQLTASFNNVSLGKALTRLNYKKVPKRINGKVCYGYLIKKIEDQWNPSND